MMAAMTKDEQEMMDSLSRNVTALCEAIDPTFTHGPETEKIVAWEKEIRDDFKLLLTNLYDEAFKGDAVNSSHVLSICRKLGWEKEIQERLWGKPKPQESERSR